MHLLLISLFAVLLLARLGLASIAVIPTDTVLRKACKRHGRQSKAGPVSAAAWTQFQSQPFQDWLRESVDGRMQLNATGWPAPQSVTCQILINDAYRFLYIKAAKVGGTSFTDVADATRYCAGSHDPPRLDGKLNCLRVPNWPEEPLQIASEWASWTVIGHTRSPWTRAVSSYTYIPNVWKNLTECQPPPSFKEFTENPNVMGLFSATHGCNRLHPLHDFLHVEPMHWCLRTDTGEPAVDYIISYENLEADVEGALELINSRRAPELPAIINNGLPWRNGGGAKKSSRSLDGKKEKSAYAVMYEQCGAECTRNVLNRFGADFEFLGCPVPSQKKG